MQDKSNVPANRGITRCPYVNHKSVQAHLPQLLYHVITFLPLRSLFNLARASPYVSSIVIQEFQRRYKRAICLPDRRVMLEAYHPSAQLSVPNYLCNHLGILGADHEDPIEGNDGEGDINRCTIARLSKLYSMFQPQPCDTPAGSDISDRRDPDARSADKPMTTIINLDDHEMFSQLCIRADLVHLGPRDGIFSGIIDLLDKMTLRLWRNWLVENTTTGENQDCSNVLWLDDARDFGLKVKVFKRTWRRSTAILYHQDEDQAVSFELHIEGTSTKLKPGLPYPRVYLEAEAQA